MDFKELEIKQKINKMKSENDCLVCEVIVTEKFKKAPISAVSGHGGPIEMALLIKTLEDVAAQLKKSFPETNEIIPMFPEGDMRESYKNIELDWRRM